VIRRSSKYNNQPTPCRHGHMHASVKEASRCNELHLLERAGKIERLEQQPQFPVEINAKRVCVYKADFAYFEGGRRVVEDVKGYKTDVYKLKKKLVEAAHPGVKIVEV